MIRTDKENLKPETITFAIIKIGNIPWEISTYDVVELIAPFLWKSKPSQDWVHIPIDRDTGKTLSDLFVEIPTFYEAQIICSNLDKHIMKQRALSVSISCYDELLSALIKPCVLSTGLFITPEEVDKILDICTNYKV